MKGVDAVWTHARNPVLIQSCVTYGEESGSPMCNSNDLKSKVGFCICGSGAKWGRDEMVGVVAVLFFAVVVVLLVVLCCVCDRGKEVCGEVQTILNT
jgi:hypothetical protein